MGQAKSAILPSNWRRMGRPSGNVGSNQANFQRADHAMVWFGRMPGGGATRVAAGLVAGEGAPMPKSYAQRAIGWCAGRPRWKNLARMAASALIWLMAITPCAFAGTEFEPWGGPGGSAFRSECPPGQYMVGARWRSGYWLDQISITCAPVDATGLTGSQWHGPTFGGNGGDPHEQSCPPGSILRQGMPARYPDNHFVNFIDVGCYPTTYNYTCCTAKFTYGGPAVGTGFRIGAETSPAAPSVFGDTYNFCPTGEAVIGIQGRAGLFVDAISLICGAFTEVNPSHPEPRPEACRGLTNNPVPEQWSDMLNAHNERRKQHCVPALGWSNELARDAQAYAEKCILDKHGSTGENMADAWQEVNGNPVLPASTDRQAFEKTWYCEVNNYDFTNPEFKGGFTTNCKDVNGHFTQVVWKDTCQLGCGRATCEMTDDRGVVHKGTHWVCRYKPPGNINTTDVNVLKQQVHAPTCER